MSEIAPKLQRGSWAPNFEMFDLYGNTFRFDVANQQQPVWLAFYRYATCPMCNQHFDDVVSRISLLARHNIRFIAVFESAVENFPAKVKENPLPMVTIIPDQGLSAYNAYGVETSIAKLLKPDAVVARVEAGMAGYTEGKIDGRLDRVPAHFLILPGGYVHFARYGRSIADHLKWRELDEFYEAIEGTRMQGTRSTITEIPKEESAPARDVSPAPIPEGGLVQELPQQATSVDFNIDQGVDGGTEIDIDGIEEREERSVDEASSDLGNGELEIDPEDDKTMVLPRTGTKS